jgi:hypothetical protein
MHVINSNVQRKLTQRIVNIPISVEQNFSSEKFHPAPTGESQLIGIFVRPQVLLRLSLAYFSCRFIFSELIGGEMAGQIFGEHTRAFFDKDWCASSASRSWYTPSGSAFFVVLLKVHFLWTYQNKFSRLLLN